MDLSNSWPGGYRQAISQAGHDEWNQTHYPGTRQMCIVCGSATERTEDCSLFDDDGDGPLCLNCWNEKDLPK